MNNRHFLRLGTQIPEIRIDLEKEGKEPTDKNIADVLGVKTEDIPILEASRKRGYSDGGFKVWDISKIQEPVELAYVRTFGFGTHRFDMDENYAYISTEMEGYIGNILVIYSLADPANPVEVSRWWMQVNFKRGVRCRPGRVTVTAYTMPCALVMRCGHLYGMPDFGF